jgi:uncharacterized protein (DUF2384 family)
MGEVIKLGSSIWFDGFKVASKSIKAQLKTLPSEEMKRYTRIWQSLYELWTYDKDEYLDKCHKDLVYNDDIDVTEQEIRAVANADTLVLIDYHACILQLATKPANCN